MEIKAKPLFERVIVKEIPEPDVTKGGVLIPSVAKDVPNVGIVKKIGHMALVDKDCEKREGLLKEGDVILYAKYSGLPFEYKKELYKIVMINEILVVYDEEEADKIKKDAGL